MHGFKKEVGERERKIEVIIIQNSIDFSMCAYVCMCPRAGSCVSIGKAAQRG